MNLHQEAQLIECGVDWVTVTAKSRDRRKRLANVGTDMLSKAFEEGDEPKPFNWKGYEGLGTRHIELAERHDTTLLRVHGPPAFCSWVQILDHAENCTRLDVQATYRIEAESAEHTMARMWKCLARRKLHGKKIQWHYRRDSSKGNTLEIGRRASSLFGRAYDKGKESKLDHYKDCLRCEVENKAEQSKALASRIARARAPEPILAGNVCSFFHLRGVVLPATHAAAYTFVPAPHCHEIDRYLQWLRKSVRKGVARAVDRKGLYTALEALGLSEQVLEIMMDHDARIELLKERDNANSAKGEVDWIRNRSDA